MPTYTKSNGQQINTEDMPEVYLDRALNKAIENGDQDNIDALQQEKDNRNS